MILSEEMNRLIDVFYFLINGKDFDVFVVLLGENVYFEMIGIMFVFGFVDICEGMMSVILCVVEYVGEDFIYLLEFVCVVDGDKGVMWLKGSVKIKDGWWYDNIYMYMIIVCDCKIVEFIEYLDIDFICCVLCGYDI